MNTAKKDQLLSLPGVTAAEADRVIAGRPYNEPGEVVTRHTMPKTEYEKLPTASPPRNDVLRSLQY